MLTTRRRRVLVLAAVGMLAIMAYRSLTAPPATQSEIDREPVSQRVVVATPTFKVSRVGDELRLVGHTFSQQHEQRLLHSARRALPSTPIATDFDPLGIVPDYWPEVTLALPALFNADLSGHAELSHSTLSLELVSRDTEALNTQIATLTAQLPGAIKVRTDIISIDADFSVAKACASAFDGFSAGEISFEENGSEFRPSAFPRLQRVAALAAACTATTVTVTGHTDSSGNEAWNMQLSLQRANAVVDYLATLGIDRERIKAKGAGSSAPIMSNATRFGRSKNRRIDIAFSPS